MRINPREHFTKGITSTPSTYYSAHFIEQLTNLTQRANERT